MALPDGPKASPALQTFQWIRMLFSFMQSCHQRYGDSFTIRLSRRFGPLVLFSHPEALQTILTNDDAKLFEAPGSLNVTLELITGTQSVFGLSGEQPRRSRPYWLCWLPCARGPSLRGMRLASLENLLGAHAEP